MHLHPAAALGEGAHTVVFNVSDNDGNAAAASSVAFTVDTVPPVLNITAPADGLVTNQSTLIVSGSTNDTTSNSVTVKVKVNSGAEQAVTVGTDGTFSHSVTLTEGANTIVITATDAAGKTTSITRTVTLDTGAPCHHRRDPDPQPRGRRRDLYHRGHGDRLIWSSRFTASVRAGRSISGLNEASGRWETAVPASPSGVYVIELWAEDEAGNVGYFATIEVTFDSSKLCTSVKILDVGARFTLEEVRQALGVDLLQCGAVRDSLMWSVAPEMVMAKIVRCEVCGK